MGGPVDTVNYMAAALYYLVRNVILIHLHHPFIFAFLFSFKYILPGKTPLLIAGFNGVQLYIFLFVCLFDNQMSSNCVPGTEQHPIVGELCLEI